MDKNKLRMLNEINSAIIQFRGNYSAWCKATASAITRYW